MATKTLRQATSVPSKARRYHAAVRAVARVLDGLERNENAKDVLVHSLRSLVPEEDDGAEGDARYDALCGLISEGKDDERPDGDAARAGYMPLIFAAVEAATCEDDAYCRVLSGYLARALPARAAAPTRHGLCGSLRVPS